MIVQFCNYTNINKIPETSRGKTPYGTSVAAKFPVIKYALLRKFVDIFPPFSQGILFAVQSRVPEN